MICGFMVQGLGFRVGNRMPYKTSLLKKLKRGFVPETPKALSSSLQLSLDVLYDLPYLPKKP